MTASCTTARAWATTRSSTGARTAWAFFSFDSEIVQAIFASYFSN